MTFAKTLRRSAKKVATAVLATVTAAGLAVSGAGVAHADPRADLRPGCTWDPVQYFVQDCKVPSPSMARDIHVLIKPAARGGNAGLYMLDGMRASDNFTGWTAWAHTAQTYVEDNITVAMPIGGAGSFYADWIGPAKFNAPFGSSETPLIYKWETFLSQELPTYLEQNFGVARNNNSIAGLSMGGTAALNLSARHPEQFRQALSYSGYPTTTLPGAYAVMGAALIEVGGFNINNMYGALFDPARFANDPLWNMDGLQGKDIYVSAASGLWGGPDMSVNLKDRVIGSGLEGLANISTRTWEAKARMSGLNVTSDYPPLGIHNWFNWDWQMQRTHDRVLDVMGAR